MSRPKQHREDHLAEDRQEMATRQDRHRPHVTENDEDAPVQDETQAPNDVTVLPANASGTDKVDVDDQAAPIDEESMYDQRPERDKDRHV